MSLLAAVVLALLGALGTLWVVWLRREGERDAETLAAHVAALAEEVAAQRAVIEAARGEIAASIAAQSGSIEGMRAELAMFVHGPPSLRRPPLQ